MIVTHESSSIAEKLHRTTRGSDLHVIVRILTKI